MSERRGRAARLAALLAFVVLAAACGGAGGDATERLFAGGDLRGWRFISGGGPASPAGVFTVAGDELVISGSPVGYLVSDQVYRDFTLRYEWRFADPAGGNSGLLLYIRRTTHRGAWPACIEVQGMQAEHGDTFAIGGAGGEFITDKQAIRAAVRPGEWNTTEVLAVDGRLAVLVNGVAVSSGLSRLEAGRIGWQSEGAELRLRNVTITI